MDMTPKSGIAERLRAILEQGGDRQQQARLIVDELRAAGPYRWAGIYDVDLQRNIVANVAWSGPAAPTHPVFQTTKGLTSQAIGAKKTVNIGDVGANPNIWRLWEPLAPKSSSQCWRRMGVAWSVRST